MTSYQELDVTLVEGFDTAKADLPVRSMPSRKLFFQRTNFSTLLADPEIIGLQISRKVRTSQKSVPGSLYARAAERFGA